MENSEGISTKCLLLTSTLSSLNLCLLAMLSVLRQSTRSAASLRAIHPVARPSGAFRLRVCARTLVSTCQYFHARCTRRLTFDAGRWQPKNTLRTTKLWFSTTAPELALFPSRTMRSRASVTSFSSSCLLSGRRLLKEVCYPVRACTMAAV